MWSEIWLSKLLHQKDTAAWWMGMKTRSAPVSRAEQSAAGPQPQQRAKKKAHASCRIEADEHWKEPQIHTLIQWLVRKPPAFWSLTHVFRHFCFYIKWSGLSRSQKAKLSSMAWAFIKDKDERCLWQREHMAGTSSAGGVWVQRGKLLLAPGGMAF